MFWLILPKEVKKGGWTNELDWTLIRTPATHFELSSDVLPWMATTFPTELSLARFYCADGSLLLCVYAFGISCRESPPGILPPP